jgi:hypothetical protein
MPTPFCKYYRAQHQLDSLVTYVTNEQEELHHKIHMIKKCAQKLNYSALLVFQQNCCLFIILITGRIHKKFFSNNTMVILVFVTHYVRLHMQFCTTV